MTFDSRLNEGAWVLVHLRVPGRKPAPVGVLLVDSTNTLNMSFRKLSTGEKNADIAEVFQGFEDLLKDVSHELGGRETLRFMTLNASNTIEVGELIPIEFSEPSQTLTTLFEKHVLSQVPRPHFNTRQINTALKSLPTLPSSAIEVIRTLNDPLSDVGKVEAAISRDPALASHLLRVANSAAFAGEVRTVAAAISRIGFENTTTQVLARTVQRMFSSVRLRQVWNHSIEAAQEARRIVRLASVISPSEASLLGLIHDVGQIAFTNLGKGFDVEYARLESRGMTGMEIEEMLCGITHAEAGADLLQSWNFPLDFCEAIRNHHSPTLNITPLSALLFVAEARLEANEDAYDFVVYGECIDALGIREPLAVGTRSLDADLAVLRAVA